MLMIGALTETCRCLQCPLLHSPKQKLRLANIFFYYTVSASTPSVWAAAATATTAVAMDSFFRATFSYLLCCRFVVCDLFLQVGRDSVYWKVTIKDNDILNGLCKTPCTSRATSPPRSSTSTRSRKFRTNNTRYSAQKLRWNWKRAPLSARPYRLASSVRTRNRSSYFKSLLSCLS